MLDFERLKAPADHRDILVAPSAPAFASAVSKNVTDLNKATTTIGGRELSALREETRQKTLGAESAGPVIVAGHQPEFMHAGVWAKHVVASRLAAALGGVAVNLSVDSDVPANSALVTPKVSGSAITLERIALVGARGGTSFEQFPAQSPTEIDRFECVMSEALGEQFDRSMLPQFLDGIRSVDSARDWVDQIVSGRRAIEHDLGVRVTDRRISKCWWAPLLAEFAINARRFAEAYNKALRDYRRVHKVRRASRPMPDLDIDNAVEVPAWAGRIGRQRQRLFVQENGQTIRLFAGAEEIFYARLDDAVKRDDLVADVHRVSGWHIRPRALALTMWARLALADLFIHGIGGAKYDRITNDIIRSYFGIKPPAMACVSATMRLDLPQDDTTAETLRERRRRVRDVLWNPQRHIAPANEHLAELAQRKRDAVEHANHLREQSPQDHSRRRETFREIRQLNQAILNARPQLLTRAESAVSQAAQSFEQNRIARSREYFFAFFSRNELERLLAALPDQGDFAL